MAPVRNLKKAEIVYLSQRKCEHSHTFLDHYECYLREHPDREKVGYIDIETSNFNGNAGIILSYSIKTANKNEFNEYLISPKELRTILDKKLCQQLVKDMLKYDRLIGYYSSGFDIKFIRTRCVINGIDMPGFGGMKHLDLYFMIRNKFKLSRNSLEVACRTLLGKTNKTHFDAILWMRALQGNEKCLKEIATHNRYDVIDTELLYDKVAEFSKQNETSW